MDSAQSPKRTSQASDFSPSKRVRLESTAEPARPFFRLLHDAGISFDDNGPVLTASGSKVRYHLERCLQCDSSAASHFIDGLEDFLGSPVSLRQSLLPLRSKGDIKNSTAESLAKIVLGIPDVQPKLVSLLFEKIPEYFGDEDENMRMSDSVPRLIIGQLKWIEAVTPESKITDELQELIQIAPLHIKREAIGALPEIVADEEHSRIVQTLKDVLDSDPQCTNAVLDALSNLALESELQQEVAEKVMDLLRSASAGDLPMVVRYLVQSSTPEMAAQTVRSLRQNLNFIAEQTASQSARPAAGASSASLEGELLTFEALKSGLKFRKALVTSLLSEIKKVDCVASHCPFDVWALVLVRSIGDQKRQNEVDKIVRQKVSRRHFCPSFLRESIQSHCDALRPFFHHFCMIATGLLRANDSGLAGFGSEMYQILFEAFSDDPSRQEVLGHLTTHTGGGSDFEVDGALQVLSVLASKHSVALRPFVVYVKGVLDYLDNLKHHQIRKLFAILSSLSTSAESGTDPRLDDDVFIHIRKLVGQPGLKQKQQGFIGAVSATMALSTIPAEEVGSPAQDTGEEQISLSQRQVFRAKADQAIALLDTVKSSVRSSYEAKVFLCDELATAVLDAVSAARTVKPSVLEWITENLTPDFEERYLVGEGQSETQSAEQADEGDEEVQEAPSKESSAPKDFEGIHPTLKVKEDLAANHDFTHDLALGVAHLVQQCKGADHGVLATLCAEFRIMQATYKARSGGSLNEMDALLSCPMYVFDGVGEDDFCLLEASEQEHVILSHFYAANWIIEVLNAFAAQGDDMLRGATTVRANQLLDLLQMLNFCLDKHHLDLPDLNAVAPLDTSAGPTKAGRPKKGQEKATAKPKGKGKGKGKEKAKGAASTPGDNESLPSTSTSTPVKSGAGSGPASGGVSAQGKTKIQLASTTGVLTEMQVLRLQAHCFRELDLSALHVLSLTQEQMQEEETCDTTQSEPPALETTTLLALLQDLWSKLDRALAGPKKAFAWAKAASSAGTNRRRTECKDTTTLLQEMEVVWPAVRKQFENTAKLLGATEDTMAVDEMDTQADSKLSDVMLTILSILDKVVSCPDLIGANEQQCLVPVLRCFGAGNCTDERPEAAALNTFTYLKGFSREVPSFTLSSALVSVLAHVAERCQSPEVDTELSELALECLQRDWPDSSSKLVDKEVVTKLLRVHILLSHDHMGAVEKLLRDILVKMKPNAKAHECTVEGYPMIATQCFRPFFKLLFECTSAGFVRLETEVPQLAKGSIDDLTAVVVTSVNNFSELVQITKESEDSAVFYASLRSGNRIVTSFIRILPVLSRLFKTHQDFVLPAVKQFQNCTRTLQHVCAHGKVEKDKKLVAMVPVVKKNLEMLLYKVKAVLAENGCISAWWLGNLRHRTVNGEAIPSQASDEDAGGNDEVMQPVQLWVFVAEFLAGVPLISLWQAQEGEDANEEATDDEHGSGNDSVSAGDEEAQAEADEDDD